MAADESLTGNCKMTKLLEKCSMTITKVSWDGDVEELKTFVKYLPDYKNCDIEDLTNNNDRVSSRFECTPNSLTVTLYNSKTVQFQGKNEKRIKQYISNKLEVGCFPIYENESKHIIRRVDEEPILGYPYQFCAAFFHTHEWLVGDKVRKHQCLDKKRCIISKRALDEGFKVQPKTVVAVVKFENNEKVVYEAKYTNCLFEQMHAEDFFKEDVDNGELKTKIANNPNGIITMYLTLQPCHKSVSIKGTEGTPANKSCCDTLKNMYIETLKDKIEELHIKVTHIYRLCTSKKDDNDKKKLGKNAVEGIKDLMDAGIKFRAMNQKDWDYLSSMTMKQPRDELDHGIRGVLHEIATTDKETLLNPDTELIIHY